MSCMCMSRSRTQPICGEHDVAKKKTHVAVKVHAKRKGKEVAEITLHLPMVPLDSPAMGTRSKKFNPASPAMSTRSKRRLSLWFSCHYFPYHVSFWKLSCLCDVCVDLGSLRAICDLLWTLFTCYMRHVVNLGYYVIFMWTWTIVCHFYVNLNVYRWPAMWDVCIFVNVEQLEISSNYVCFLCICVLYRGYASKIQGRLCPNFQLKFVHVCTVLYMG